MEYIDEESKPRFQLQSQNSSPQSQPTHRINKTHAAICISIGILLFSYSILLQNGASQLVMVWIAFSLVVGPFAPISVTGGDIRVGVGELLEEEPDHQEVVESKRKPATIRAKSRRSEPAAADFQSFSSSSNGNQEKMTNVSEKLGDNGDQKENQCEKEWNDSDLDLLRKQMAKHPPGKPGRWDLIAQAFNGKHGLESIIKMAKSLSEKKPGGSDSYAQFLKQRKPLDDRVSDTERKEESENAVWSSGEDIALLNALKAFPKETPMRWEKVAASVPGKSKASCMKRLAELRKDFRSSKASDT
ncbi:hypothetical protein AMTRI_Chr02g264250 [Amborella trichopoda]|uniref:Myb-like domain-containing protein n=1 Tax=Amborella trichopoda TaxID=13333 RepID=U5D3L3_AMBTC|nr:dnaJ homolog subfamily C member 2 [Amborella trichopoda]ERN16835.1 hypothetical protein AMTR_s00057p00122250 [Amborella trichopoda]|eukprot:XP_006855368.1 dnaJ homolog subfamily C member 2 [Amborella trichopoda]